MSEWNDYAATAREHLDLAVRAVGSPSEEQYHFKVAQTAATLALVEQQRIANLIALSQAEDEYGKRSGVVMREVWANRARAGGYDPEPRPLPEIAAALGIEAGEEDE